MRERVSTRRLARASAACVLVVAALGARIAAGQALPAIAPLDASGPIGYYVVRTGAGHADTDPELAVWALDAWSRSSEGRLRFEPAAEEDALIRVYFVPADYGLYGEMRPFLAGGRRGAAVYIRAEGATRDLDAAGAADPLMRDTIVYLTCLHELGHALGLVHTDVFEDIMYFFGFGGDIDEFFGRYRRQIESRDDLARLGGVSRGDLAQLARLYGGGR